MTSPSPVGRVEQYLREQLLGGPLHFTLIDPDKSPGKRAAALARGAVDLGSHAILLGGSTGISREVMGEAAREVKRAAAVPAIIFPEGPGSLTPDADAVLFMSLLNSRNLDLVIRTHARSAGAVRKMELEAIPMGYLVIAPGMRVGEVGAVDPVPRDDLSGAAGYALAAEMLGMRFVYLEAGSGAPAPVPIEMVRHVRDSVKVPLIVGGGIRSGADAKALLDAGANILVTGTITEEEGLGPSFHGILEEVRRARSA
ncbi:MAG TPA: geranylgeranylglyceryl/heptaprenylglyceryl phosphate synthase [Thermoplasmata archaeon]|nr:geranylgeranylglyceryl/heptaprenylglyceryl phosphate synthase [Thermoplasmata archaeon]